MNTRLLFIALSFIFGLFFWIIEILLDLYFSDASLNEALMGNVLCHGLYSRLITLALFLIFGYIMAEFIILREKSFALVQEREKQLSDQNREYRLLNDQFRTVNEELRKNNQILSDALKSGDNREETK
ncbi:MAG: hypothetical protein KJ607_09745 [Bacteroidetes bacterium]|nr:hypothetical protein [Bacteroidota bacterium]